MKDTIEKIMGLVGEYAQECKDYGYVSESRVYEALRTALEQALAAKPGEAEPIGYLAFRDGKPAWDADDCVCEDPVYPVDADDDRTSVAIYTAPPARVDGLPLVIAGALFDFAGFLTTRSKVIPVGSTADAAPMADLVKEWAALRGLSLDDAAVQSWQEWLPPAPQPTKDQE